MNFQFFFVVGTFKKPQEKDKKKDTIRSLRGRVTHVYYVVLSTEEKSDLMSTKIKTTTDF